MTKQFQLRKSGAPYASTEQGHLLSEHTTLEAAETAQHRATSDCVETAIWVVTPSGTIPFAEWLYTDEYAAACM